MLSESCSSLKFEGAAGAVFLKCVGWVLTWQNEGMGSILILCHGFLIVHAHFP